MIKLEKLSKPLVLQENAEQWTADFKAAKAANVPNLETLKTRYGHPEIKAQLLRETHEKCAYCESKMRHVSAGEIDHIKPKSAFEDDIFFWENLTLSCSECNRRKSNRTDESVGILNPYVTDPDEHLWAAGEFVFAKLGDIVGQVACAIFDLNRTDLVERRKDRILELESLLQLFATINHPLLKAYHEKKIKEEMESNKEYAMVTRAFVGVALAGNKTRKR